MTLRGIGSGTEGLAVDGQMEGRHLAVADRNIAEGEKRVERQLALVERLQLRGRDTKAAEDFLGLLRQTLAGWQQQRIEILGELGRQPG